MKRTLTLLLMITMFSTANAQISFAPAIHYVFTGNAEHLATGDFNSDGLQDVAVNTDYWAGFPGNFRFYVYLQSSVTHTLLPPVMYSYGLNTAWASCMASGDVNSDSKDDIVIGYANSIAILTQDNGGGFNNTLDTVTFSQTVNAVKVGDANNDGINDIVISFKQQPSLSIIFGSATGILSAPYFYPGMTSNSCDDLEITSLDGSPLNVIIKFYGNAWNTPRITFYYVNANRALDSVSYKTLVDNHFYYFGAGIAVGNIHGNGSKTIILGKQWLNPSLAYWSNTNQTVFDTLLAVPYNTGTLATGDLDCDGKDDIVMMRHGYSRVAVVSNYTIYNFPTYCGNSSMPDAMALVDVNGDGALDIVSVNSNQALSVLINNHTPCAITLPIELISFTAELVNGSCVKAKWSTATEINNDFFSIERSKDGKMWESIGAIQGCGTCSYNSSYTFDDVSPLNGISYYRIKQTDYDGHYTYSEPVVVDLKKRSKLQAWSDQAKRAIFISGFEDQMTIGVYDTTGKLMVSLISNNRMVEIPIEFFPKGCYLIKAQSKNELYSTKVIL